MASQDPGLRSLLETKTRGLGQQRHGTIPSRYRLWLVHRRGGEHTPRRVPQTAWSQKPHGRRGRERSRAIAPNPSGNIELVFPWIATLCSVFSAHHEKQDRIFQFLEALRDMPKHDVYECAWGCSPWEFRWTKTDSSRFISNDLHPLQTHVVLLTINPNDR